MSAFAPYCGSSTADERPGRTGRQDDRASTDAFHFDFAPPFRRAPARARLALLTAGCNSLGGPAAIRSAGVAEVEQRSEATETNIASLNQVVSANPNSPEPYNTRGAAFARVGRFQEAITDFSTAIKLDPNNVAAYTNRALAYRQINRAEQAQADFNMAISVNPRHAPAYVGRANLLRSMGRHDEYHLLWTRPTHRDRR